jgi:hypothetical protein
VLAFTSFPKELWRQTWSNHLLSANRLNREIRRRTHVARIFSDRSSLIRLVGAVLAEQHGEWTEGRRYLGLDLLAWVPHHRHAVSIERMWIKNLTISRMAFGKDHGGCLVSKAASPRSPG